MEIIEGILCINPIIEKFKKRYIWGISAAQAELFVLLLNKNVHIDGFVSGCDSECGILFYNKPIISMQEAGKEPGVLLATQDSDETQISSNLTVCSDIFLLNPQLIEKEITIYGAGKIGRKIYKYLKSNWQLEVKQFIDKNADFYAGSTEQPKVVTLEEAQLSENSAVLLGAQKFYEMGKELNMFFEGKCYIPYEFMGPKYWLNLVGETKAYSLDGDIYNLCYHMMHLKSSKYIIYGTGEAAWNLARLYKLLDGEIHFFVEDADIENLGDMEYEVRQTEDILYEESCFVLIVKKNAKRACRKLESLGLKYAKDYIVAAPFRVDKYFLRFNPLDINLGYTYVVDSSIPGFKAQGGNTCLEKCKFAILGGSTTDAELFPFASWPEIMYDMMGDKGITMYMGGVAGYESSQELIKLMRDVLALDVDMVVVFSGFNDTRSLSETPFAHSYLEDIFRFAAKHYKNDNSLCGEIEEKQKVCRGIRREADNVGNWLKNIRMMHAICEEFGIKFLAFLQPMLASKKQMDKEEFGLWKMASVFYGNEREELPRAFREWGKEHAAEYDYIYDLSGLFDEQGGVYMDDVHVTEKGNQIIAEAIYQVVNNTL